VWPEVRQRVPGARLWIAGGGDLEPDLRRFASGQPDAVEFHGVVPDEEKQRLLGLARCLTLPSRGEGFGLVYSRQCGWVGPAW